MKLKTPRQLIANHDRMLYPPLCVYGHFGCSCTSKRGGPCLDEQMLKLEHECDEELKRRSP